MGHEISSDYETRIGGTLVAANLLETQHVVPIAFASIALVSIPSGIEEIVFSSEKIKFENIAEQAANETPK
jgi:hypothetical protein